MLVSTDVWELGRMQFQVELHDQFDYGGEIEELSPLSYCVRLNRLYAAQLVKKFGQDPLCAEMRQKVLRILLAHEFAHAAVEQTGLQPVLDAAGVRTMERFVWFAAHPIHYRLFGFPDRSLWEFVQRECLATYASTEPDLDDKTVEARLQWLAWRYKDQATFALAAIT